MLRDDPAFRRDEAKSDSRCDQLVRRANPARPNGQLDASRQVKLCRRAGSCTTGNAGLTPRAQARTSSSISTRCSPDTVQRRSIGSAFASCFASNVWFCSSQSRKLACVTEGSKRPDRRKRVARLSGQTRLRASGGSRLPSTGRTGAGSFVGTREEEAGRKRATRGDRRGAHVSPLARTRSERCARRSDSALRAFRPFDVNA